MTKCYRDKLKIIIKYRLITEMTRLNESTRLPFLIFIPLFALTNAFVVCIFTTHLRILIANNL